MVEWVIIGILLFGLYWYDAKYNEDSELYKIFHNSENDKDDNKQMS